MFTVFIHFLPKSLSIIQYSRRLQCVCSRITVALFIFYYCYFYDHASGGSILFSILPTDGLEYRVWISSLFVSSNIYQTDFLLAFLFLLNFIFGCYCLRFLWSFLTFSDCLWNNLFFIHRFFSCCILLTSKFCWMLHLLLYFFRCFSRSVILSPLLYIHFSLCLSLCFITPFSYLSW